MQRCFGGTLTRNAHVSWYQETGIPSCGGIAARGVVGYWRTLRLILALLALVYGGVQHQRVTYGAVLLEWVLPTIASAAAPR